MLFSNISANLRKISEIFSPFSLSLFRWVCMSEKSAGNLARLSAPLFYYYFSYINSYSWIWYPQSGKGGGVQRVWNLPFSLTTSDLVLPVETPIIPPNFWKFRMADGRHGIKKDIWIHSLESLKVATSSSRQIHRIIKYPNFSIECRTGMFYLIITEKSWDKKPLKKILPCCIHIRTVDPKSFYSACFQPLFSLFSSLCSATILFCMCGEYHHLQVFSIIIVICTYAIISLCTCTYWGRILGRKPDKRQKSFPPC